MIFYEKLEPAMEHFTKTGGFLTVKDGGKVNTMTVSWGFIGFLWAKPHFITVVRPHRYTDELIKNADSFTISIPFGTMMEELKICGTKSGRDIDKSRVVKFVPAKSVDCMVVSGCDIYYECRINYKDKMDENLLPEDVKKAFYNGDFHNVYIGEIVEVY